MSRVLCDATDLHLVYKVSTHRPQNLRDLFISLCREPFSFFAQEKDRKHVLQGVNFQIHSGDRIALLGVNGAGKTSLCRLLSQVMRPTSGKLVLHGQTRGIFQTSLMLYPELTGWENAQLLSALLFPHMQAEERKHLLDEACRFADLGASLYMPFRTYSTGMQTRLMLSLVTAQTADLLILDEVFDGADFFWQQKAARRMQQLIERAGALIFVSHNPELVQKVCNQVWILQNGNLQIFTDPAKGFSAYLQSQPAASSEMTNFQAHV